MTYKQMTKEIEKFDTMIKFMYEVQKEKNEAGDKETAILCGDIVNALCGYKNYHIYVKQYDNVDMCPQKNEVITPTFQYMLSNKKPRCDKCVYELHCSRDRDEEGKCPRYKRDPKDGGYYG